MPEGVAAAAGPPPPPPDGPAPPQGGLDVAHAVGSASSRHAGPLLGWVPLVDHQGHIHWWDTVLGRTTWHLPDDVVTRGPAASA